MKHTMADREGVDLHNAALYEACADAELAYERVMAAMEDLTVDESRLAIGLLFAAAKRCAAAAKQARGE